MVVTRQEIMEKLKQFLIKYDNGIVFLFILFSVIGISLNLTIVSTDEIWNFQNLMKMVNGYQIYQDANVIVTPLFFFIGLFLFQLLGANLLIFRCYHILILTGIFFMTYLIGKKIKINRIIILLLICLFIVYSKFLLVRASANYNLLVFFFVLVGLFLFLRSREHSRIQGMIGFIIFLTKQNVGVFYTLGFCFYQLISKKSKRHKFKAIINYSIIFGILGALFTLFFAKKGLLSDFLNYTFLGIGEFAAENRIIGINMLTITTALLVSYMTMVYFIQKKKIVNEQIEDNIRKLTSFAIPMLFIQVPIINEFHFILSIYLLVISLFYLLNEVLFSYLWVNIRKIGIVILTTFAIFIVIVSGYNLVDWTNYISSPTYPYQYEDPFFGGVIREEIYDEIEEVTDFIQNTKGNVIVLSEKAALYMIPLRRSNGFFDLPFLGNMGKEGERVAINKILELKDTKILILKDEKEIHQQESEKIIQFVKENLEYQGEIRGFLIYHTKN